MAGLLATVKSWFSSSQNIKSVAETTQVAHPVAEQTEKRFFQQLFHCNLHSSLLSSARIAELDKAAQRLLKDDAYRQKHTPRLPAVVPQLMRCLRDDSSSGETFAKLVQQEPSLAAAVLKMSRNPFFNPRQAPVDSFEKAVVILGTDGLRSLLCTTMLQPIIQRQETKDHNFGTHIWEHALRSGVSAQVLAKYKGCDPFEAYLGGLVHVIGDITCYGELSHMNFDDLTEKANAFYYLHRRYAPLVTAKIVSEWEMPKAIEVAIPAFARPLEQAKNGAEACLLSAAELAQALALSDVDKFSDADKTNLFNHIDTQAGAWSQAKSAYQQLMND